MAIELKKTVANCNLSIDVDCPYCDQPLNLYDNDEVRSSLDENLRAKDCNIFITCEECGKEFIVTEIEY